MSLDISSFGIDQLSVGERLELIEVIWDSLPEFVLPGEVPQEHITVLQKRRDALDQMPESGIPWREVLDQLGSKS